MTTYDEGLERFALIARSVTRLFALGAGAVVALPLVLLVGLAFSRFFPLAPWIAVVSGVAVSSSIVAVVLPASRIPARRAPGFAPRAALADE